MVPSVLVVMPLYNAVRYLEKSIGSVLAQTFTDYCLLIVDDGSTDGSVEFIRNKFNDERLVILSQPNSGPGVAMNRALHFAREKGIQFIARMDADDISMPNRLQVQYQLLLENPACAGGSANCFYIDEDTEAIVGTSTVPFRSRLIRWEVQNGLRGLIQGAAMFRTEALMYVGGYRPGFRFAEETDLFLRLLEHYELVNSKEYLYKIRLNRKSLSMKDIPQNIHYHFYALECARKRKHNLAEDDFETFLQKLNWRLAFRVRHEEITLWLWRLGLSNANPFSLLLALMIDPRRLVARILRNV